MDNQHEKIILIKRGFEEHLPIEAGAGELLVTLDTENLYVGQGPDNELILLTPVKSVNGQTGIIKLDKNDIGLSNVLDREQASKEDFDDHVALEAEAHGGIVTDTDYRLSDSRTPTEHGNELHSQDYITAEDIPVQSVNGLTGEVELTFGKEDFGLGNVLDIEQASKADFDAHTQLGTEAHGGIVVSTDPRLSDSRTPTEHGNESHNQSYVTLEEIPVKSVNGRTGDVEIEFTALENVDNVQQMPKAGGKFEGDVDFDNHALIKPKIEQYSETLINKLGQIGTVTLDLSGGNVFHIVQGEGAMEFEFLCPHLPLAALTCTLVHTLPQEEQAVTFPASVQWADKEIPDTPDPGLSVVYTFFTLDSGNTWIGTQAISGLNLPTGEGE